MSNEFVVGSQYLEVQHSTQMLLRIVRWYLDDEPTCIGLLDRRWSQAVEAVAKGVAHLSWQVRGQVVTVLKQHWRQEHDLLVSGLSSTESYRA